MRDVEQDIEIIPEMGNVITDDNDDAPMSFGVISTRCS